MVVRSGHSLVELLVAMMVLGVALSGVAATSTLSLRFARDALRLEEDAARAAFILDSLAVHGAPTSGASTSGASDLERTTFDWVVTPMPGGWSRLAVTATDGRTAGTIVELTGAWAPPPPGVTPP